MAAGASRSSPLGPRTWVSTWTSSPTVSAADRSHDRSRDVLDLGSRRSRTSRSRSGSIVVCSTQRILAYRNWLAISGGQSATDRCPAALAEAQSAFTRALG